MAHPAFEAHALDVVAATDPYFVDEAAGDYRVRTGSAASHSGGAIPAAVATAMGAATSAGQDRGALTWATP